jgi:hypothetical protein
VAKLIGQKVEAAVSPELSVEAEVSVRGSSYALRLSWGSAGNATTRNLSAKTCAEIVDAAALFIALSLAPDQVEKGQDSLSTASESGESEVSEPTPGSERTEPPVEDPKTREAPNAPGRSSDSLPPAQSRPLHFALGLYSAVWVARLPAASPGLEAFGGLSRGDWTLSAGLGAFLPQKVTSANGSLGADLWLGSFRLDLARGFRLGPTTLIAPLVGTEVELIHGVGTGALKPRSGSTLIVGLEAGVRLTLLLSARWALLVQGELSVLTSTPSFYVEGATTDLYRPPGIGGRFGLGAQVEVL